MLEGHSPSICHISFEYNLYSCFKVHPISQCLTKAQEALLTLSLSLFFYKNPVGGLKNLYPWHLCSSLHVPYALPQCSSIKIPVSYALHIYHSNLYILVDV